MVLLTNTASPALPTRTAAHVERRPKRPTKWRLQAHAIKLLPGWRIVECQRRPERFKDWSTPVKDAGYTRIQVMRAGDKAYFRGLWCCGNVWVCPVCAGRIAEKRRSELEGALLEAVAQGLGVSLLTITFRHSKEDLLEVMLPDFTAAIRRMKSGKMWQQVKKRYGIVGSVRALEITHGKKSGWHPHSHEVLITRAPLGDDERDDLRQSVFKLWRHACAENGLGAPSAQHGVDVIGGDGAAAYVSKWGVADEVTGSMRKRGEGKGRTPWQLLLDSMDGDRAAGRLFQEFARCFIDRRQLVWSAGLRDFLKAGRLFNDAELAAQEPGDVAERAVVADVDEGAWVLIASEGLHEEVLRLALTCKHELEGYLETLRRRFLISKGFLD